MNKQKTLYKPFRFLFTLLLLFCLLPLTGQAKEDKQDITIQTSSPVTLTAYPVGELHRNKVTWSEKYQDYAKDDKGEPFLEPENWSAETQQMLSLSLGTVVEHPEGSQDMAAGENALSIPLKREMLYLVTITDPTKTVSGIPFLLPYHGRTETIELKLQPVEELQTLLLEKKWNSDKKQPVDIQITGAYKNGQPYDKTVTLSEQNSWKDSLLVPAGVKVTEVTKGYQVQVTEEQTKDTRTVVITNTTPKEPLYQTGSPYLIPGLVLLAIGIILSGIGVRLFRKGDQTE